MPARREGAAGTFASEAWRASFRTGGFATFDDFWGLEAAWVEPVNERRGGWSGVVSVALVGPDGDPATVFVKRQYAHQHRDIRHPIVGVPTVRREVRNYRRLAARGPGTPELLFFADRRVDGVSEAILVTRGLEGFTDLNTALQARRSGETTAEETRRAIGAIARAAADLHRQRLQHHHLHGGHLFFRVEADGRIDVRMLDLESLRPRVRRFRAAVHDLGRLEKATPGWTPDDRRSCLGAYCAVAPWSGGIEKMDRALTRRAHR